MISIMKEVVNIFDANGVATGDTLTVAEATSLVDNASDWLEIVTENGAEAHEVLDSLGAFLGIEYDGDEVENTDDMDWAVSQEIIKRRNAECAGF